MTIEFTTVPLQCDWVSFVQQVTYATPLKDLTAFVGAAFFVRVVAAAETVFLAAVAFAGVAFARVAIRFTGATTGSLATATTGSSSSTGSGTSGATGISIDGGTTPTAPLRRVVRVARFGGT